MLFLRQRAIELLAGDVRQHHAVAVGEAELALIAALGLTELGIFGQLVHDVHCVLACLFQRICDPLDPAMNLEVGIDLVDVVESFELPVLHLQQQKPTGWMQNQKVGILPLGADWNVEPTKIVVLQQSFQALREASFA
ncbi:MAG: hypothetical protein MUF13_17855 [Akkermansiaceae bacterium]|nr:hypothetical protein [Akkermansiaceae bacterium]